MTVRNVASPFLRIWTADSGAGDTAMATITMAAGIVVTGAAAPNGSNRTPPDQRENPGKPPKSGGFSAN
jgi:hypothetical protein